MPSREQEKASRMFAGDLNTHRQGPAEDGWKRLLDWFKKNGVV